MTAPTNEELHRRLSDAEGDLAELQKAVGRLEVVLPNLQNDITSLKEAQIRSDEARAHQTQILTDKLDEVKDKALVAVPVWASTTITILSVLLAALATAFFTK